MYCEHDEENRFYKLIKKIYSGEDKVIIPLFYIALENSGDIK